MRKRAKTEADAAAKQRKHTRETESPHAKNTRPDKRTETTAPANRPATTKTTPQPKTAPINDCTKNGAQKTHHVAPGSTRETKPTPQHPGKTPPGPRRRKTASPADRTPSESDGIRPARDARGTATGATDPFNAEAHAQPKAGRTVRTSPAAPRPPSAFALRSAKSLRCANARLPAASPLSAPAAKPRRQAGAAARAPHVRPKGGAKRTARAPGAAGPGSQPVPAPTNAARNRSARSPLAHYAANSAADVRSAGRSLHENGGPIGRIPGSRSHQPGDQPGLLLALAEKRGGDGSGRCRQSRSSDIEGNREQVIKRQGNSAQGKAWTKPVNAKTHKSTSGRGEPGAQKGRNKPKQAPTKHRSTKHQACAQPARCLPRARPSKALQRAALACMRRTNRAAHAQARSPQGQSAGRLGAGHNKPSPARAIRHSQRPKKDIAKPKRSDYNPGRNEPATQPQQNTSLPIPPLSLCP